MENLRKNNSTITTGTDLKPSDRKLDTENCKNKMVVIIKYTILIIDENKPKKIMSNYDFIYRAYMLAKKVYVFTPRIIWRDQNISLQMKNITHP